MYLNTSFFEKKSLLKFFYYQFIVLFLIFICIYLLTYKKHSITVITLSMLGLYLYAYLNHICLHIIPKMLNVHLLIHHTPTESNLVHSINLILETIVDLLVFYFIYYLQYAMHVNYIPNIIIFFYALLYSSIHIINYSIFHLDKSHVLHHATNNSNNKKDCNFWPDTLDHLLSTNCDNRYENMYHYIPNILIIFLITYYVFKPKLY
jgi:hypothetical protein